MAEPRVIIMTMKKAEKDRGKESKNGLQEEGQKRTLKVFQEELGTESSKFGEGDYVEFRILGKLLSKGMDGLDVDINNVSLIKPEEQKKEIVPPVPSPSA